MKTKFTILFGIAAALLSNASHAGSPWPDPERSTFVAGCVQAIIMPAKRDYTAAAERAKNANPKPFPESELRESVEPMCACLADRMVEIGLTSLDTVKAQELINPMIYEAIGGGRCKPGGLFGQMITHAAQGSKNP